MFHKTSVSMSKLPMAASATCAIFFWIKLGIRKVLVSLLVMTYFLPHAMAVQSRNEPATAKPATRACALLTRELVMQVTPYEKQSLDLVMRIPPDENSVGASGSACTYGGITMQIDPFPPAAFEKQKQRDKAWVPVSGVGDTAFFFDRRGEWAELFVTFGTRVLTIQMDIPTGQTATSIQPNVIALAKALLAKMK
jgi:hypothetical protein